ILFYYGLDFDQKKTMQQNYDLFVAPAYMNYVTIFRDLFRFALGVMCLVELRRYSKHLQRNYSDIEKLELNWLRLLVIGFLAIRGWSVLVVFLVMLAVVFGIETNFELMGLTGNYTTFVLISLLIFYSLGHAHLAEGLEARSGEAEAKPDETAKEKFKPEQIQALTLLMENEKPYLQPALTLEKLASQLQM